MQLLMSSKWKIAELYFTCSINKQLYVVFFLAKQWYAFARKISCDLHMLMSLINNYYSSPPKKKLLTAAKFTEKEYSDLVFEKGTGQSIVQFATSQVSGKV